MRFNIATKISILIALLVLVTGMVTAWLIDGVSQKVLQSHALSLHTEPLKPAIDRWETEVGRLKQDVNILSTSPEVQDFVQGLDQETASIDRKKRLADSFRNYMRNRPSYIQMRFIGMNDNGRELVRVDRVNDRIIVIREEDLQQKGGRDYYREAVLGEPHEVIFSEVNLNREHGEVSKPHTPVLRASIPIYIEEHRLVGFVIINKTVESLLNMLREASPQQANVYLINQKGQFLLHPEKEKSFGFEFGDSLTMSQTLLGFGLLSDVGQANGEFLLERHGEKFLQRMQLSLTSDKHLRYVELLVETPESFAEQYTTELRNSIVAITGGMALLAIFAAILFSRFITRPLQQINASTLRIGEGDYSAPLPTQRDDEIGSMSRSIETMVKKITDQRESLQLFARAMAHDLKEPIRTTKSYINILQPIVKSIKNKDLEKHFERIYDSNVRMDELIDMVSIYTRLDRDVVMEPLDINEVVRDAIENLDSAIKESGAEIFVDPALPHVKGNISQMRQLFQNLIANSIKYCNASNPKIEISYKTHGGKHVFAVKDNGIGIDSDAHLLIFEPFKRLHSKDEYSGSGIGLAICNKIVNKHGGNIWCESEEGHGSVFYFNLANVMSAKPHKVRTLSRVKQSQKEENRMKSVSFSLANILLAEDSQADVELLKLVFESQGVEFNLFTVVNGKQAMQFLRHEGEFESMPRPDMVMLDINMPIMDGHEVLRAMKGDERLKDIPVVMLSTSSAEEDIEKAKREGASHYFVKPPNVEKMLDILPKISEIYVEHCEEKLYLRNDKKST